MRNKQTIQNNQAITLIALVITIIVLLILAGVTLNLTLGERGIFKTAEYAAKNYTEAQDKELSDLDEFLKQVEEADTEEKSERKLYCLGADYPFNFEEMGIGLNESAIKSKYARKYIEETYSLVTDEDIFVFMWNKEAPEEEKATSFEDLIEKAYQAGEIEEKYKTVRELINAGSEEEYQKQINEILFRIVDAEIVYLSEEDIIPATVQSYQFIVKVDEKEYTEKIDIGQYQVVMIYNYEQNREYISAVDLVNKKIFPVKNATIIKNGNKIEVSQEKIVNKDNFSGVDITGLYEIMNQEKTRTRLPEWAEIVLKCENIDISGWFWY